MLLSLEARVQEAHDPTTASKKIKMEEELEKMMQSVNNQRARRIKAKAREKYPEKILEAQKRYREKNTNKIPESEKRYNETNKKKSGSIKDNIERKIKNEYGRIVDDILKDTERLYQFNKGISREKC